LTKLGPLVPVIDAILEADKTAPPKQRHTAKRIFERLRLEHGYAGGYTVVKDYVRLARTRAREMFVPLPHPPGHAQVDFGECIGVIGGVRTKLHVFCFDLPQSDTCFIKAYPAETTEAFLDGHVSAFAFFVGVPISILYDNLWTLPRKAIFSCRRRGMRESIRPVAGAIAPLEALSKRPVISSNAWLSWLW
jgi:transposase